MIGRVITGAVFAAGIVLGATAHAESKTFYWVSHGSPADPVWTYYLAGAEQWAEATGNQINTSFHNGDVPAQQEAVRAAIAAGAAGIVVASPQAGALVELAREAATQNIPIVAFNSNDDTADFLAFVGGDNFKAGAETAQYALDNDLVEAGDFVWMPVEVPGATYGADQERGIASVFEPLGITWEVTEATLDQAEIIARMSDYLTANRDKVDVIFPLGDLVSGSIKRVFDQVGVQPGEIPVVGWGNSLDTANEVLEGYVQAAHWHDPQAASYLALSLAAMASDGISPNFDILTGSMYEKDEAPAYIEMMSPKE